jgi:hypothetical protein
VGTAFVEGEEPDAGKTDAEGPTDATNPEDGQGREKRAVVSSVAEQQQDALTSIKLIDDPAQLNQLSGAVKKRRKEIQPGTLDRIKKALQRDGRGEVRNKTGGLRADAEAGALDVTLSWEKNDDVWPGTGAP